MNADLHTDLANKEEREKIALAGRKVKTVVEALTEDKGTTKQNVIKAGLRAINIDELRKDKQKEFNLVDDKETAPLDKLIVLRDLQAELYKREGYTGELPELLLTDEPNSFVHNGKIFISVNDLNSGNASALLYAHENAHLVDYDKGEEIAKYAETKIGKNDPNKRFTESEKEEYINNLRETVKIDKTLEEQFEIARNVPTNERENWAVIVSENASIANGLRFNTGSSVAFIFNPETKDVYLAETVDFGVGIGSPSIGYGPSIAIFPNVNTPKDLEGWLTTVGTSGLEKFALTFGGELHFDDSLSKGFRLSASWKNSNITKNVDMSKIIGKGNYSLEGHLSRDYSKVIATQKLLAEEVQKYMRIEEKNVNLDHQNVQHIIKYINGNQHKFRKNENFEQLNKKIENIRREQVGY